MEQSWRWFGPDDTVPLHAIRPVGARGVVTSLHQIPYGDLTGLFDTYRQAMRNLADCGVRVICYNFMPVVDRTRTELRHTLPGGGTALRFDAHEYAAFDALMLQRPGAEADHSPDTMARTHLWFAQSSEADRDILLSSIMTSLPGAFDRYDIPILRAVLARYADFLRAIIPTAENGITSCTGSLHAVPRNDVPDTARRFAPHVHFVHLRNVSKEPDGSFMETEHLAGDTDMVPVIETMLTEQARRRDADDPVWRLPFRPDHGHELLDDVGEDGFPGYSAIGRLKELAELRGGNSGCGADARAAIVDERGFR